MSIAPTLDEQMEGFSNMPTTEDELYAMVAEGHADVLAGRTQPLVEAVAELKHMIHDGTI